MTGPAAEYRAAREDAALFDLSSRGKIHAAGADRVPVLHSLLTNDIKSLAPGSGCHAAFLTAQGKIIGDMHVYVLESEVLLDVEAGLEEKLLEALGRFIITEDVALTGAGKETAHFALWGPRAADLVRRAHGVDANSIKDHGAFASGNVLVLKKPPAIEIICEKKSGETEMRRLLEAGAVPGSEETYETLRIEAGILRYGRDMDESVTLPETGLDRTAASETKGCYPGQEVVARTNTYKGHAKKIVRVEFETAAAVKPGEKLHLAGQEAGWITSACVPPGGNGVALGYALKGRFDHPSPVKTGAGSAARIIPLF